MVSRSARHGNGEIAQLGNVNLVNMLNQKTKALLNVDYHRSSNHASLSPPDRTFLLE